MTNSLLQTSRSLIAAAGLCVMPASVQSEEPLPRVGYNLVSAQGAAPETQWLNFLSYGLLIGGGLGAAALWLRKRESAAAAQHTLVLETHDSVGIHLTGPTRSTKDEVIISRSRDLDLPGDHDPADACIHKLGTPIANMQAFTTYGGPNARYTQNQDVVGMQAHGSGTALLTVHDGIGQSLDGYEAAYRATQSLFEQARDDTLPLDIMMLKTHKRLQTELPRSLTTSVIARVGTDLKVDLGNAGDSQAITVRHGKVLHKGCTQSEGLINFFYAFYQRAKVESWDDAKIKTEIAAIKNEMIRKDLTNNYERKLVFAERLRQLNLCVERLLTNDFSKTPINIHHTMVKLINYLDTDLIQDIPRYGTIEWQNLFNDKPWLFKDELYQKLHMLKSYLVKLRGWSFTEGHKSAVDANFSEHIQEACVEILKFVDELRCVDWIDYRDLHRNRMSGYVFNAMGGAECKIEPVVTSFQGLPGDRICVYSDGISSVISQYELALWSSRYVDDKVFVEYVRRMALARNAGYRFNIETENNVFIEACISPGGGDNITFGMMTLQAQS